MKIAIAAKCQTKTRGKTIVCQENGRRMVFHNRSGKKVTKIRVDGCVFRHEKACDYLVLSWTGEEHYVELKGKNVEHALTQLAATIRKLSLKMPAEPISAWVVSSETPSIQSKFQIEKLKFAKAFNATLTIRTNQAEHPLQ